MSPGYLAQIIAFLITVIVNKCDSKIVSHVQVDLVSWPVTSTNNLVDKNGLEAELGHITYLEGSGNKLSVLDENTNEKLGQLYKLDLVSNGVKTLKPGAFRKLPYLRELNISHNAIETIPKGVFNQLDISRLDLSFNEIQHVEEYALSNMPRLRLLYLTGNKLTFINNEWFKNCPKLDYINLSFNEITALPGSAFKHLKSPNVDLILKNNKIKFVHPEAFQGMKSIGNLRLDHNRIKTLNEKFLEKVESVDILDLEDNEMTCLPDSLENILSPALTRLDRNNWDCDCALRVESFAIMNIRNIKFDNTLLDCRIKRIESKIADINSILQKAKTVLPEPSLS